MPNVEVIADVVAPEAAAPTRGRASRRRSTRWPTPGCWAPPLDPPAAQRELAELLAGCGCHDLVLLGAAPDAAAHPRGRPAGLLTGAPAAPADELLPGLRSGRCWRPWPSRTSAARAHRTRWRRASTAAGGSTATLDWVTSWDIADVVMVMAQGATRMPTGSSAATCRPARSGRTTPGVRARPATRPARDVRHAHPPGRLDGVHVPDAPGGAVLDRGAWLAGTRCARRTRTRRPSASPVGRSPSSTTSPSDVPTTGCASWSTSLVHECRPLRARCVRRGRRRAPRLRRLALRAASLDLAARAATRRHRPLGGGDATRVLGRARLREAMFLQVQAQTAATRQASLALMRTRALAAARRTVTYGPLACADLRPPRHPSVGGCRVAPVRRGVCPPLDRDDVSLTALMTEPLDGRDLTRATGALPHVGVHPVRGVLPRRAASSSPGS